MGEFIVDAPAYDDKMGETTSQKAALQVSVSFGRFENDSLAWEKWSTFSPNKYLEEVEKCATPGSVAQKKAYFEAHYKKIAARKAELLAQEGKIEKDPLRSGVQNVENLTNDSCTFDSTLDASNYQSSSAEEIKQETDLTSEVNSAEIDNPAEGAVAAAECRNLTVEDGQAEEETKDIQIGSDSNTSSREAGVCVQKQGTSIGNTEEVKELPHDIDNDIPKVSEVKVQNEKLDRRKESKKVPLVNNVRDAAQPKNKIVSPVHKETPISKQKAPRVAQIPTKAVALGVSAKKGSSAAPSLSRRKDMPTAASKGVPNKSLHMSLNMSASTSDSASPMTMRKSFILEKMGDKDIVKRVFKTFHSSLNQLKFSAEDGPLVKKQVPARGMETKISASMIGREEHGRRTKVNDASKNGVTAVPSTLGLKRDGAVEKMNEKLVEKSNAKQTDRMRLQSKSQVEKESEIKKVRRSVNLKATPVPGSYPKQKISHSTSDKGNLRLELKDKSLKLKNHAVSCK